MIERARPSLAATLAVGAFGVLSLLGGWMIVMGGGFFSTPSPRSVLPVWVEGLPALLMATLQWLAAALAFTWLLRQWLSARAAGLLGFALVFGPAVLVALGGV